MPADKKPLPPVVGKFRLRPKSGTHTEGAEVNGVRGVYFVQPGQVVEARSDLAKRWPEKFEKVDDNKRITATFVKDAENGQPETLTNHVVEGETPLKEQKSKDVTETDTKEAEETYRTYEGMTAAELRAEAADQEIDLGEAKSKKDILRVFAEKLGVTLTD